MINNVFLVDLCLCIFKDVNMMFFFDDFSSQFVVDGGNIKYSYVFEKKVFYELDE